MVPAGIGADMDRLPPVEDFGMGGVGTANRDQEVDMGGIHRPDQVREQDHFLQEAVIWGAVPLVEANLPGAGVVEVDLPEAEVPEDLLSVVILLAEAVHLDEVPLEAAHLDGVPLVEASLLVEETPLEAEAAEAVSPGEEVPEDANEVKCFGYEYRSNKE